MCSSDLDEVAALPGVQIVAGSETVDDALGGIFFSGDFWKDRDVDLDDAEVTYGMVTTTTSEHTVDK